jgi:hypothetical protein
VKGGVLEYGEFWDGEFNGGGGVDSAREEVRDE